MTGVSLCDPSGATMSRASIDPIPATTPMTRALLLLVTAVTATATVARPVTAQADDVILVRGATVHTAVGAPISNGSVLIRAGKIAAVGANVTAPAGTRIIDATGKTVTPGMIDNHSHIGARPTD